VLVGRHTPAGCHLQWSQLKSGLGRSDRGSPEVNRNLLHFRSRWLYRLRTDV